MKSKWIFQIFITLSLFLPAIAAQAENENLARIQERMRQRLPQINELKAAGLIGENNRGYLEPLGEDLEAAEEELKEEELEKRKTLITKENEDRKKVYTLIAKKVGTTPELVGRRRARQIAEAAVPGVWIQTSEGDWIKKKKNEETEE